MPDSLFRYQHDFDLNFNKLDLQNKGAKPFVRITQITDLIKGLLARDENKDIKARAVSLTHLSSHSSTRHIGADALG